MRRTYLKDVISQARVVRTKFDSDFFLTIIIHSNTKEFVGIFSFLEVTYNV